MKVFLSSTALDLGAYRKVADDTIVRLSEQTIAMERFGALPNSPVEECERMARECDVAVCIVAHRYGWIPEKGKGSITRREVEAAKNAGKDVLVWIVADDHPWNENKETDQLADPNVFNDLVRVEEVREAVKGLSDFKAWLRMTFTPETFTTADDLGRKIALALANYVSGHNAPPVRQDNISIARLPTTGSELFGRETELQILDDAWTNPNTNIVSFVAWGGVGKTALVNHWLKRRMARDNYRGAERVYGWSFFSQGTSERATSADLFIDQALRWFGDADPTQGSPWDKGERLASFIRQTRTLLILDGLEPLQHPPGPNEGRLKDAAIQAFLVELAAQQGGLSVISTRERIRDLVEFEDGTVVQHDLEYLSPQAGAQILRSLNIKGETEELEKAAIDLGGHAFSLTLLGSYLDEVFSGDIRRRREIENLFDDTRYGDAAQKMIAAYEQWLGEGMELAILRLLGLFDRPADLESVIALCEPPSISGLTEPLQHFKGREWSQAVAKLRRIKLLAEETPNEPGTLDAHPLVREYFKQQLKREHPDAWHEGNNRIYEYLKNKAKELPDTLEEMSPLVGAVAHGCAAGKYRDVLVDVFSKRIQRGDPPFSLHKLGAFDANLTMLSSFFLTRWLEPVSELTEFRGFLLNAVGHCLRAVGRLQEAAPPLLAALELDTEQKRWESAAAVANNLAELYHSVGDLPQALELSQRSIDLAEGTDHWFMRMASRTVKATALHELGQTAQAEVVFCQAEDIQKAQQPYYLHLYSIQGFRYNDLLLSYGQTEEVKLRATRTLEWATDHNSLLAIALDNLILGRALLRESQTSTASDFKQAEEFLKRAVGGLRRAGTVDLLPLGLLARAELHRLTGKDENAERDLAAVLRIATRGEMGLHLADYYLESARLSLSQRDKEKVRVHLANAKEMIERMGYHRRDKEAAELEAQLG